MNKTIFLLVIVLALLVSLVACEPNQNKQNLSVDTVQTTAAKDTSTSEKGTDPVDTNEKGTDDQSGEGENGNPSGEEENGNQSDGLQVGEDTETGYGGIIPIG